MKLTKENYVDEAEKVMKKLSDEGGKRRLTTSKIRNLLGMISDIYNDVRHVTEEKLDSEMVSRIQYLKMHIAYEAGREDTVKHFVEEADLFNVINNIGRSREKLILFCHYMEALVAYHRYYGGRDN